MYPRWLVSLTAVVLAICVGGSIAVAATDRPTLTAIPAGPIRSTPAPPRPSPLPFLTKQHLDVFAWAVYDRRTGRLTGENLHAPSYTASVMKIWYAQDALDLGLTGYDLEAMIRDSDDGIATALYDQLGVDSTVRAIQRCDLEDATVIPWSWSRNSLSAADVVNLALCVGPVVQGWMAGIRGESDFGPRELLGPVMAKNGWMPWDGQWYVNCLAMTDEWVLVIIQRYQMQIETYESGFARGREGCRNGTAALLA